MPILEEKVGWVDFLREKNYRKSTKQLADIKRVTILGRKVG